MSLLIIKPVDAMLRFNNNLYIGDMVESADSVIDDLKNRSLARDVFLLCTERGSKNPLEIIRASEMSKSLYRHKDYVVSGLADSREEATELLVRIVREHIDELSELKNFLTGVNC